MIRRRGRRAAPEAHGAVAVGGPAPPSSATTSDDTGGRGDEPSPQVLDELLSAFGGDGEPTVAQPQHPLPPAPPARRPSTPPEAPSIDVDSLVPEPSKRAQRRSRREAKRESKAEAKRVAHLESEAAKLRRRGAGSERQVNVDVEALALDESGDVRIIPGSSTSPEPGAPAPRSTISIADDGLPDAVFLEPEQSGDGAGGRSTVFIDDRGPGTGEIVAIDVATSAARIEPRMRQRRIAVKRAAGRKRLRWLLVAGVGFAVVVGVLAVLGSKLFAITDVDVEGAVYSDGDQLDAVVDFLDGANVLRVDTDEAERRLEAIPYVADARVTTEFPHGATIEIRERRPIVTYAGNDGAFRVLDSQGRVLEVLAGQPVGYLELIVGNGPALEPGQLAPIGFRAAATLVSSLTPQMRQRATSVSADENATQLSLTIDDGVEVRFGAAEDLLDKLVRLQTALTDTGPNSTLPEVIDVSTGDLITR